MKIRIFLLVLAISSQNSFAYNRNHGPFKEGEVPEKIEVVELAPISSKQNDRTYPNRVYRHEENNIEIHAIRDKEPKSLIFEVYDLSTRKKSAYISDYPQIGVDAVYHAFLNSDDTTDYILLHRSAGVGLASGYSRLHFLLSNKKGFKVHSLTTMFFDPDDLIRLEGDSYFIHTEFIGCDDCANGKPRNYWVYNLLKFADGAMAPTKMNDFPKWTWYSFKPRHHDTNLISDEMKKELWSSQSRDNWVYGD